MLVEWRIQRSIQIGVLIGISLLFSIPGIILIVEQESRQNYRDEDAAMNTARVIGPLLLVVGMLVLGVAVVFFAYTQMAQCRADEAGVDGSTDQTGTQHPVFTISGLFTENKEHDASDDYQNNASSHHDNGGARNIDTAHISDDMYAPKFDDDLIAIDLAFGDDVAPGGPQTLSSHDGIPPHTDIVTMERSDTLNGDLSNGFNNYQYGIQR